MERIKPQERIFNLETKVHVLEQELTIVKERNARIERDKAWEVSNMHTWCVTFFIYVVFVITLYFLGAENVFLSAFLPSLGFLFSTQLLSFIKRWWIHRFQK